MTARIKAEVLVQLSSEEAAKVVEVVLEEHPEIMLTWLEDHADEVVAAIRAGQNP